MQNRRTISILCLLISISLCANAAESRVIRVGAYENAPKIFTAVNGEVVGIFPDILKRIATEENWDLKYVHGTWNECLQRLERGEIDVMPDVAFSEDRARKFAFGTESVFVNWGKVYTPKRRKIDSLLDLDGKTVAVLKGAIYTEAGEGIASLLEKFDVHANFIEVDGYDTVFQLLDEEAVDAGIVNRLFGQQYENDFDVFPTSILFDPRPLMYAFPQNAQQTPYLASRIDYHLHNLKAERGSHLYRIIDGYVLGFPPQVVRRKPGGGREVYLSEAEKAWIRDHPVIRLGIDPEFAPYEFIDDEGKYDGIASGYIELLNKRLGLDMRIVPDLSWDEAVEQAKRKTIDVLPCVGMTKERKAYLAYSRPYIVFQRVIVMRADAPFVTDLSEISGLRIGVQTASSHEGYLHERGGIAPVGFTRLQDAVTALSRGEVDAVVGNLSSASYWIRKLNLSNLKVAAAIPGEQDKLHFAVRNDWPELVGIINKGLASIDPAEADEMRGRWVSVKFETGIETRKVVAWIAMILSGALLILGLMTAWNRALKREICRREDAERSRDVLTHMIVHDLNNQLSGILGSTELLLNEYNRAEPNTDKVRRYITQAGKSATEMASQVEGILTIAKLESGNMPVSLVSLDAAALLDDIRQQFAALAEDKGISIDPVSGMPEATVLADRGLLTRVLQNLISNSLRYAGAGSRITCSVRSDTRRAIIGVQDNGAGIPEKYRQKIFDKFFRVECPQKTKTHASGLGLAFCKMAVEVMGGTISLETPSGGKGIIFLVELNAPRGAELA